MQMQRSEFRSALPVQPDSAFAVFLRPVEVSHMKGKDAELVQCQSLADLIIRLEDVQRPFQVSSVGFRRWPVFIDPDMGVDEYQVRPRASGSVWRIADDLLHGFDLAPCLCGPPVFRQNEGAGELQGTGTVFRILRRFDE